MFELFSKMRSILNAQLRAQRIGHNQNFVLIFMSSKRRLSFFSFKLKFKNNDDRFGFTEKFISHFEHFEVTLSHIEFFFLLKINTTIFETFCNFSFV